MTPMIDIVFLLIIFFLVSSHLSRQANRHPVTLAQATSGTLEDIQNAPLTLSLDRVGRFYFGGELIPVTSIRDYLVAYQQEREKSSAAPPLAVRLRIDRSLPYGDVEPILKVLAEQGVADVAIVVSPRESAESDSQTQAAP